MLIETYEVSEVTSDLCSEDLDRVKSLLETLNLPEVKGVYRRVTKREEVIFRTLMPRGTKLEEYKEAIPLRILEIIESVREDFPRLVIWHPEVVVHDPVLVGFKDESWKREAYLIARWGEALESMADMAVKAGKQYREKVILSCLKAESMVRERRAMLEALSDESILEGHIIGLNCYDGGLFD